MNHVLLYLTGGVDLSVLASKIMAFSVSNSVWLADLDALGGVERSARRCMLCGCGGGVTSRRQEKPRSLECLRRLFTRTNVKTLT